MCVPSIDEKGPALTPLPAAPSTYLALLPEFGTASDSINFDVDGDLPAVLLPPPHLVPFLGTNVLSHSLSTPALLQTLVIAQDLEEVGFFGHLGNSRPRVQRPPTFWAKGLAYARQIPLLGTYIVTLTTSSPPLAYPFPNWAPFQRHAGVEGTMKALPSLPWPASDSVSAEVGKRLSTAEVAWLLHNTSGKLRKVYV